jgi:hypothetical protein
VSASRFEINNNNNNNSKYLKAFATRHTTH